MCGLTGIIFGKKSRTQKEYQEILTAFTTIFTLSEERGIHASGVALLRKDGMSMLFKRPIRTSLLKETTSFKKVLDVVDDDTTLLMGHSRWKTVGSEKINKNNQPIMTEDILGEHNGTIYNADALFDRFLFHRNAEVDSEVLFRMADRCLERGILNTDKYRNYLSTCRGKLTCVLASRKDPECVYLVKGNNPLALYFNTRLNVFIYSSEEDHIKEAIKDKKDWQCITLPPFHIYQTCYSDFSRIISDSFKIDTDNSIPSLESLKSRFPKLYAIATKGR